MEKMVMLIDKLFQNLEKDNSFYLYNSVSWEHLNADTRESVLKEANKIYENKPTEKIIEDLIVSRIEEMNVKRKREYDLKLDAKAMLNPVEWIRQGITGKGSHRSQIYFFTEVIQCFFIIIFGMFLQSIVHMKFGD